MRNLLILLLIFSCKWHGVLAQSIQVSGRILDEAGQPLPDAIVMLKTLPDSTLYKGELTNESGYFQFQQIKPAQYLIQINYIGYQSYFFIQEILPDENKIELQEIRLIPSSTELSEVSITGQKSFIERQADKTIVNIENSIIQTGATLYEVFEKLPGVMVDQDGNIRIRGKSGVVIAIDGKPLTLSGSDLVNFLRGLNSGNVQKIEVITNPSSRWDAAGNSGILNVITKRNIQAGWSGNLGFTYGQGRYPKYGAQSGLNYRSGKFAAWISYGYSNRNAFNNLVLSRRYDVNGLLQTRYETNNYITYHSESHTPRIGLDFYPTKSMTISYVGSFMLNQFGIGTSNHTDLFNSNNTRFSTLNFGQKALDEFSNYDMNLQLTQKLDTSGQQLTVNLDYVNFSSESNQDIQTRIRKYFPYSDTSLYLRGFQAGKVYLYSGKIDYQLPINKNIQFESGAKISQVGSDRDMRFYNRNSDSEVFDSIRSSHFLYNERISAGYLTIRQEFKKLTVQAGIRGEHTFADGLQKLNQTAFRRNYFQIFPTIYLDYHPGDHSFNLNMGRRINRPAYEQMNPFRRLIDYTTYGQGNPLLLPQLTYTSEFTWAFKNKLMATLAYSYTSNNITDVLIQDASTQTTIQTVVNLAELKYYSLDINYSGNVKKWWRIHSNLQSYYADFTGRILNYTIDQGRPSFFLSCTNNFTIQEGLSAEMGIRYNHQNLYGVTLEKTTYNVSTGVQKSVLKKRGTITLNLTDIFWRAYPRGITTFGEVTEHWNSRRDTRVITIGFNYKFGNGTNNRMRRSTAAEEERNRM